MENKFSLKNIESALEPFLRLFLLNYLEDKIIKCGFSIEIIFKKLKSNLFVL